MSKKEKKEIFGSIPLFYNFWEEFEFHELNINMRQKDDLEYVDILNRIRFGVPNEQDIQKLNQRIIPKDNLFDKFENATNSFLEIAKTQPAVICLFPLTKSVDTCNGIINKKLNFQEKGSYL